MQQNARNSLEFQRKFGKTQDGEVKILASFGGIIWPKIQPEFQLACSPEFWWNAVLNSTKMQPGILAEYRLAYRTDIWQNAVQNSSRMPSGIPA